jgi:hypothetical protein
MTELRKQCIDCGDSFPEEGSEIQCVPCRGAYWEDWCEECGADPDEPCEPDCPNK